MRYKAEQSFIFFNHRTQVASLSAGVRMCCVCGAPGAEPCGKCFGVSLCGDQACAANEKHTYPCGLILRVRPANLRM